jgi:hypothetical protein
VYLYAPGSFYKAADVVLSGNTDDVVCLGSASSREIYQLVYGEEMSLPAEPVE